MNAYPLRPLLAIRTFREDAAKREAESRRKATEFVRLALAECRQAHETYAVWRIAEEKAMFSRIQNKEIPLSEVENFKQNVLILRAREQELLEAILCAEKELETAKTAEAAAKTACQRAIRDKLKIMEHQKIWSVAEDIRQERASEAELEEFQGRGKTVAKTCAGAGDRA